MPLKIRLKDVRSEADQEVPDPAAEQLDHTENELKSRNIADKTIQSNRHRDFLRLRGQYPEAAVRLQQPSLLRWQVRAGVQVAEGGQQVKLLFEKVMNDAECADIILM